MRDAIVANRTRRAVFLMYHSIADEGPEFLSVPPALFERQLALLRRLGYRSGTIADLDALRRGERLDAPRAFLTFDDGFADNHANALPMLAEHGFGALVFVLPELAERGAALAWPEVQESLERYPATMRSMDWPMIEQLIEAGSEIGSHTLTHTSLVSLGDEELRQELLDSRRAVEDRLGRCETVAYPFGDWSPNVVSAAADAGYRYGFIVAPMAMRAASPLAIPRVPVDYRDDERRLRAKLSAPARHFYLSPARPALQKAVRSARKHVRR